MEMHVDFLDLHKIKSSCHVAQVIRVTSMSRTSTIITALSTLAVIITILAIGTAKMNDPTELTLEIDYHAHWNLTITENGDERFQSGFGKMEVPMIKPSDSEWVISINCMKIDGSQNLLSVKIKRPDGTVIKKGNTYEPFGTVKFTTVIP